MAEESTWAELNFRLMNVRQAASQMVSAERGSDLRRAWEAFLNEFGIAIGLLISTAISDGRSRAWGHRLKNDSSLNDEGLVFLREARNHIHHGVTPFANFADPFVGIGGMVALGGNSEAHFSNNYIVNNGRAINTGTFSVKAHNGKIISIEGSPNTSILEVATSVTLQPIQSEQKRKTVAVPATIGGRVLKRDDPNDLSLKAIEVLSAKAQELQNIIRNPQY